MAEIHESELSHGEVSPDDLVGEPGHPGPDIYAGGPNAHQPTELPIPEGSWADLAKRWANRAALGAGPQIAGAMGALANAATDPLQIHDKDIDAYRSVRDDTARELKSAGETRSGQIGDVVGTFSTPLPFKPAAGASVTERALQAGLVGGGAGLISGAAESKGDLTKGKAEDWLRVLADSSISGLGGAAGGALAGGALAAAEKPARNLSRRLPMDMLGVTTPARRAMQKQGIYDASGDDLLALVKPFRSGMRSGTLTEDAAKELEKRGGELGGVVEGIDRASPGGVVTPVDMSDAVRKAAVPYAGGSIHDTQVARRMHGEGANLIEKLGDAPVSLAKAEEFKKRFGPGVAKLMRHAGEPAAKTTALGETYSAIRGSNERAAEEAAAANIPELAGKFVPAKKAYQRLAAPLEGAGVERSGMRESDFDWGDALSSPQPELPSQLRKTVESVPVAGPAVMGGLNLAGRAYGRGTLANLAEFLANRAARNTGGSVGGAPGSAIASHIADPALDAYFKSMGDDEKDPWVHLGGGK